ncbi:MAG: AAA family ATPase [Humidesulfovibrio sp.]|nr:AAA family ATPase [Humidesulfovibrio sp.]
MYNEFFGFHSTPFDIVPNQDVLFLSQRHKIALDHLKYGLMSGASFILLTGEIGTGKTTLVREVLHNCVPQETQVGLIFQTNINAEQLLNMLLTEFELPTHPGNKSGALDQINQFLVQNYSQNRKVLIVVDEAQNLSSEALEELRMLSNLQSQKHMLLQVMLVGQPELRRKLLEPGLAQFAQRIAVNYHLTALSEEETSEYIAFRLAKSGGKPDLFTPEAMALVYTSSKGVPRSINLICASALLYAFADQQRAVTEEHVSQAVEDKHGLGGTGRRQPWERLEPGQDECAQPTAQPMLVQATETNQRLGAMEGDLRTLLDAFGSYQDELTRRIEGMREQERKTTQELATRCARLENVVRRVAAPLVQQAKKPQSEQ